MVDGSCSGGADDNPWNTWTAQRPSLVRSPVGAAPLLSKLVKGSEGPANYEWVDPVPVARDRKEGEGGRVDKGSKTEQDRDIYNRNNNWIHQLSVGVFQFIIQQ